MEVKIDADELCELRKKARTPELIEILPAIYQQYRVDNKRLKKKLNEANDRIESLMKLKKELKFWKMWAVAFSEDLSTMCQCSGLYKKHLEAEARREGYSVCD